MQRIRSALGVSIALSFVLVGSAVGQDARSSGSARSFPCEAGGRTVPCTAEDYLLSRLRVEGVASAMAALDSIALTDREVRRLGHSYAHAIGLAAYTNQDEVGSVFSACTPAFQSGCYHGVIQSYFAEYSRVHGSHLDAAMIEALCEETRNDPERRWALVQCVHGLGHGLMMVVENHLPSALGGCDLLSDPWEREVCYGAVFMENVVHQTMPHHAVGRPGAQHAAAADADEMGHGAHHGAAPVAREEFPALDRTRPLYPCTALEDRYLMACYGMQTSAILYFNGSDVAAAGRECLRAPEVLIPTCFQSLGRDVSALTVQDHEEALRYCALTPEEFRPYCHLGYAKNLIDLTSDPSDGVTFCRMVEMAASKRTCYIGVGEQLWVLYADPQERESFCQQVEAGYVAMCRYGAGLGTPDELQAAPSRSESSGVA